MAAKDELGRYGEDLAARGLIELGWSVLARNWRPARATGLRGEIDIVARDGDELVVGRGQDAAEPLPSAAPRRP